MVLRACEKMWVRVGEYDNIRTQTYTHTHEKREKQREREEIEKRERREREERQTDTERERERECVRVFAFSYVLPRLQLFRQPPFLLAPPPCPRLAQTRAPGDATCNTQNGNHEIRVHSLIG